MKNKKTRNIFLLILLVASISGRSQSDFTSPYSRFGVGQITENNHPIFTSMGKTYTAYRSSRHINSNNPASYTAFDTISFIFDGGISSKFSEWSTIEETQNSSNISLGYIEVGFPIFKKLKVSTGLKPKSKVGYDIIDKRYSDEIGFHQFDFAGDGGINNFYFGFGYEPIKGLSIGINASYLWGNINLNQYSSFPDSAFYWTAKVSQKRSLSDFSFTYGLQYVHSFSEDWSLTSGIVYQHKTDIDAEEEFLSAQITRFNGTENIHDTVSYTPSRDGTITLPSKIGIGFSLEKINQFRVTLDYRHEKWDQYKAFGVSDSLTNSNFVGIGFEVMPKHNVLSSFYKKIKYRLGFHYSQSALELYESNINDIGITFGLGIPIKQSGSSLNIGLELGRFGTTDNNLIKENYLKLNVGFSIFERWFIKRKYF